MRLTDSKESTVFAIPQEETVQAWGKGAFLLDTLINSSSERSSLNQFCETLN